MRYVPTFHGLAHLTYERLSRVLEQKVVAFACGCLYSVSLSRGTVGWSLVCDCGISFSYSFTFK